MPAFPFIHAADLHLGAPFQGLRAESPLVAEAADRATYRAFDRIVETAVRSGAAFVLFSGDVYDTEDRNLGAQLKFRDGLRVLNREGIPAYVIHGNHDHLAGGQARLDWPENVHFFPARPSAPQVVTRNGVAIASIAGYSYPKREMKESLLAHYRTRESDPGFFRIAMLHGNVGGAAEHDNYAPCTVEELADLPFDYWALGHVHSHQVLRKHGPAVVYPGSPQGLSPRETGTHGCCLVTVHDDRSVDVERIATHSLRWEQLEVSIEDLTGEQELLSAIGERLERELATGDSIVARVRLAGRGTLHSRLKSRTVHENLLADLRRDLGEEPFAWVDRLIVETRPALDLDSAGERDDLPGDFLRLCREAGGEGPLREELREVLDELFSHRAMRGAAPDLERLLPGWLERAAWKGADLLLGEEGA